MSISLTDPKVIIAGIRQFGLAADGSDLRDLEAEIERLIAERDARLTAPAVALRCEMVRAATIEECARVAEKMDSILIRTYPIAAAIRALKEQQT